MNPSGYFWRYCDAVILIVFAAAVIARRDFAPRFFAGMAVAAIGIALWATARWQLGASFSVKPEAKKLVTSGLYSKFRHPVYFFGGIGYTGLFIAWGNWIALGVFLLFYTHQILRVRREERVLEAAFGEDYREYKAKTWF